jgi:hypothetical protein
MTDRTHHRCQCDYCDGEDCKDLPKSTRSELTTQELIDELCKREGVAMCVVSERDRTYVLDRDSLCIGSACSLNGYAPATILVIK